MLVTALEQERKKIFQQGKAVGVAEGKAAGVAEGRVEGQRQTLLQLLQHRFQLSEASVAPLVEQLTQVASVDALTALTNHALQAATVEEFQVHLQTCLPTERSV